MFNLWSNSQRKLVHLFRVTALAVFALLVSAASVRVAAVSRAAERARFIASSHAA